VPLSEAGDPRVTLAGSSYLERIHGVLTGRPPVIDLALEKLVQAFLRRAIAAGLVASAHDLSDGGLAVALAEACVATSAEAALGADLDLPAAVEGRLDRLLFAEGGARILVSVPAERSDHWQAALEAAAAGAAALPAERLGQVQASPRLSLRQGDQVLIDLAVDDLRRSFEQAIPRRLGPDLPPTA
jgi:phosphoribosylformylglycinamidine synthase